MPLPQGRLHRSPQRWETEWDDTFNRLKDLEHAGTGSSLFKANESIPELHTRVDDESAAYILPPKGGQ